MDKKLNVLIVDDEQIVLDSITKHLRKEENLQLITTLSVEQGIEIMKKDDIHIILTDLMMPEIDGLEFLKITKDNKPDIIVIMITGYATINTALQAMQLGAFDYIAKPFSRDELKKVVKRAADLAYATFDSKGKNEETPKDNGEKMLSAIKGIGEHSWMMQEEDGMVRIGVERPFLYSVGRIQSVYLPSVGDRLRQGSVYFQVFSADLRSQSLLSPISGMVVKVNEKVSDNPNKTLEDPYDTGWLIKLEPDNFDEEVKLIGR
jgi:CheY-like chemotaxis protein/glycine cleavage system H lipoate-binding protein